MPSAPPSAPDLSLSASSAFVAAAGFDVAEVSATRVTGSIELDESHHTPWGVVHGGVYTTAVESAASIGASTAVADSGQYAVGVSNSTDFLRAMTSGRVDIEAQPVQQGRVQQLWDVRITDASGRLVARGSVRLQNVTPKS
jgi:1,4-dihydroxy-2-naphthoyl-CoA hydrolase